MCSSSTVPGTSNFNEELALQMNFDGRVSIPGFIRQSDLSQ
jgi:hypothetical protein